MSDPKPATDSDGNSNKRPRRRWLQYSLRGILVLMLLSAVGAWWVRNERAKVRVQERALEELSKLDPQGQIGVSYNYQHGPDGEYDRTLTKPDNHPWLRWLFGDGYVDQPRSLAMMGTKFTKEDARWLRDLPTVEVIQVGEFQESEPGALAVLGEMPELRQIDWQNRVIWAEEFAALGKLEKLETIGMMALEMEISPDAMREFTRNKSRLRFFSIIGRPSFAAGAFKDLHPLPALEDFSLTESTFADQDFSGLTSAPLVDVSFRNSNISDDALVHFGQIKSLKKFRIAGTLVTDAGLAHLSQMENLEVLGLSTTRVSDAGIEHLVRLPSLTTLDLSNNCITTDGLARVSEIPSLESLHLTRCAISAVGLEHLAKLPNLATLQLADAILGDDDLHPLQSFPKLKTLRIAGTQVTDAGVKVLADISQGDLSLEDLSLPETITPACVPDLLRMTSLTRLTLPRNFPAAEVAKVGPDCPVARYPAVC